MKPTIREQDWRMRYARRLAVVDAFAVTWAASGAYIGRFGMAAGPIPQSGESNLLYIFISFAVAIGWWSMLGLWGTRDAKILGHGVEEFKRLVSASLWLFGLIAIVSYTLGFDTARGYVALALPAGLLFLSLARLTVRRVLQIERRIGTSSASVLIVGSPSSAEHLASSLISQPSAGYLPIGLYFPGGGSRNEMSRDYDLTVLGTDLDVDVLVGVIKRVRPDAIALSSDAHLPPEAIRTLGWALSDLNIRLIMAPALTDVAGPRIHTQPVAGLPLIHVSTPNLERGQQVLKRISDVVGATGILLLVSPILLIVAIWVRIDSRGSALFKQQRIGAGGEPFTMLKFRSMVADAEAQLQDVSGLNEGNTVLFKVKSDPRITRAGRFIRRYSLDELPQLFNVIGGSMSLVGPRPPLPSEVEQYEDHVRRRLMVRPGLTGLWQVSGRSLLSWEDTVRLDLYYVENWSLTGDVAILLRTFRAVFRGQGAY